MYGVVRSPPGGEDGVLELLLFVILVNVTQLLFNSSDPAYISSVYSFAEPQSPKQYTSKPTL